MKKFVFAVLSAFLLFGCGSDNEMGVSNQHPKDVEVICPIVIESSDADYSYNYIYAEGKLISSLFSSSDSYSNTVSTYQYNAQGLLSEAKEERGDFGVTTSYEYDETDRLTAFTVRHSSGALRNKKMKHPRSPLYQLLTKRRYSSNARSGSSETQDDYYEYQYKAGEFYPHKMVSNFYEGGEKVSVGVNFEYTAGNLSRLTYTDAFDGDQVEFLMAYDDKPLSKASVPFALRFGNLLFAVNNLTHTEVLYNGKLAWEEKLEHSYSENGLIDTTKLTYVEYDVKGEISYSEVQSLKSSYQCD